MANALVALAGQNPQIDAMGAFAQGQQAAATIDNAKKQAAERALQIIGSAAMAAKQNPAQFDSILGNLESMGIREAAMFKGRPDMIPVLAGASMTALQQVGAAQDDARLDLALKQFDETMRQNMQNNGIQERQIGIAEKRLAMDEQQIGQGSVPAGYRAMPDGGMQPIPGGPADPANPLNIRKTRDVTLSPAAQKELFDADDAVQAGGAVVGALGQALAINDKAYSGPMAETRGKYGALVGLEGSKETEDLRNIIQSQVLESLKAVFGGMPTEGERQVLMEVQGSVEQAPEVRKGIYERAKAAAERRIAYNAAKADSLRNGTYFDAAPGAPAVAPGNPAPAQGGTPEITSKEQYDALPSGSVFVWQGKRGRKP